ncbi:MAG: 50S ribosomal protein L1 [Candidatus Kapabacteria bacterium]|jgi:large subunit ribosomal protein L1|nr:50S ribosomal protein L1 [Candidatus Kapabacteria bacterium]
MKKLAKRYKAMVDSFDVDKVYSLEEAVNILKNNATAKFDESMEISMNLGVDPRKADQLVRGTVSLPHGVGKKVKVLVLAKAPKDQEALDAGADYAGLDEYLEKIKGGWTDIDVIISTPDVMGQVGRLGRVLGPRGLMPNPKSGTVTFDVANAVNEVKAGKIEYRVDKTGNVQAAVGKCSFDAQKLVDNVNTVFTSVMRNRPQTVKGRYINSVTISPTMGAGVKVEEQSFTVAENN